MPDPSQSGSSRPPTTARSCSVAAAIAIVGGDAVGSHADAAAVHGLALLTPPKPNTISVTRPLDASRTKSSQRSLVQLRTSDLPAQDRVLRHGVPVTSVAGTVADLARTTSLREGIVVADSALHGKQTTKTDLLRRPRPLRSLARIAQARRAVDFSDALAESPLESLARLAFADGGLPPPELQAWVGGDLGGNLDGAGRPSAGPTSTGQPTRRSPKPTARSSTPIPTAPEHQLQRDGPKGIDPTLNHNGSEAGLP